MAVIVATTIADGTCQLVVAPITHTQPARLSHSIEIPKNVKRDLGLDAERSWVVLSELNRFIWPGPDVRVIAGRTDPYFGTLPDWLFVRIRDGIAGIAGSNAMRMIKRTE